MYTKYHAKYYATELTLNRGSDTIGNLTATLTNAKVDLNPHQVEAALFALKSPLNNGVILADEVGLGKTIEAGLIISQKWAERKRKILLIMPSSLRKQWNQELIEKFFIDSIIMERKNFNSLKKEGYSNPFDRSDKVVICSYNFAGKMATYIKKVKWDLVIIDEAHRLRNVYRESSKTSNTIKEAIEGYKKVLLTATPLQNNLMELYGLVSIIDPHVFGDKRSFRDQFIKGLDDETRNLFLKRRINPLCRRTLRKQVVEYVPYTERKAIVREYYPTDIEMKLYEDVSEYLRTDKLYALPPGQRHLMILILRKLLASSSYAIANTLESLVKRLDSLLEEKAIYIEEEIVDDVDFYEEFKDEIESEENNEVNYKVKDKKIRAEIEEERRKVKEFENLAKSIEENTKGKELIEALKVGFEKGKENGANEKVVIFTESRRTQEYLYQLLNKQSEYQDKIVVINGTNTDSRSKEVYKKWLIEHEKDGNITGSKTADMKAAIVDEFKNNSKILIATEAAAEGVNLQFCSLLVNYDLPWNPQRVEQRIGRCHRYGQKNDVVVINFINMRNEADQRVYSLLSQKFKLFNGVFGSSDEVLGNIESGVDFEKRVSEIYQNCRSVEEIEEAFNEMQSEFEGEIEATMKKTRSSILENFDEEVHQKLKGCKQNTEYNLNKYQKWMLGLVIAKIGSDIILEGDLSGFYYRGNKFKNDNYYFDWKKAEEINGIYLRSNGKLIQSLIYESQKEVIKDIGYIEINYTEYRKQKGKISVLEDKIGQEGWLFLDKFSIETFEKEEVLITTVILDSGKILDEEIGMRLFEISGIEKSKKILNKIPKEKLKQNREKRINENKIRIEEKNMLLFDEETEKLEFWADDLKQSLEEEIKNIDKEIKEIKKEGRSFTKLDDKIKMQKKIKDLEKRRNRKRRELFEEQDLIDEKRDKLISNMENQMKRDEKIENIITLRWKLV